MEITPQLIPPLLLPWLTSATMPVSILQFPVIQLFTHLLAGQLQYYMPNGTVAGVYNGASLERHNAQFHLMIFQLQVVILHGHSLQLPWYGL